MPLLSGGGNLGGLLVWAQPAIAPSEPEWLEVQVTTTAANQTYSWQSSAGTSPNHTTEWGDGTVTTHTANDIYSNTYAVAGVYTLRIKCSWASGGAFNMRPRIDRIRLTKLISPIPAFPGLSSLSAIFSNSSGLTGLIPVDFLRYTTNVTNHVSLFLNCTQLQMQPNIFGLDPTNRFLNQFPNFTSMFRNVGTLGGTLQGTAPEMWNFNYGTGTPTVAFAFNGNSATNISNYANIPASWL
jgi:hypothetical protein